MNLKKTLTRKDFSLLVILFVSMQWWFRNSYVCAIFTSMAHGNWCLAFLSCWTSLILFVGNRIQRFDFASILSNTILTVFLHLHSVVRCTPSFSIPIWKTELLRKRRNIFICCLGLNAPSLCFPECFKEMFC